MRNEVGSIFVFVSPRGWRLCSLFDHIYITKENWYLNASAELLAVLRLLLEIALK